jgi:hypothetical protein
MSFEKGTAVKLRVGNTEVLGEILRTECRSSHGPNKGKVIPGLMVMIAPDGDKYWITKESNVCGI